VVKRYTVSVDDETAAWIDTQADERGVSKAQVIRDAVGAARGSGGPLTLDTVQDRLEALEERLSHLEQQQATVEGDLVVQVTDESNLEVQQAETGESVSNGESDTAEDIMTALQDAMAELPPTTTHGTEAVITTVQLLRERGAMTTGELQEALYEQHGDQYANPASLWQSIQRHFDAIPGIEKADYGEWRYPGDDAVRAALRE